MKELVERSPALAKAAWDWGYGDWETALGAASHTGQREIAEYLITNGARSDIFTFVMLGKLEAVKAMVTAYPGVQRTLGPHGITMLAHARNAGDEAKSVLEYLESLGDADQKPTSLAVSEEEKAIYMGEYRFSDAEADVLSVAKGSQGALRIKRGT